MKKINKILLPLVGVGMGGALPLMMLSASLTSEEVSNDKEFQPTEITDLYEILNDKPITEEKINQIKEDLKTEVYKETTDLLISLLNDDVILNELNSNETKDNLLEELHLKDVFQEGKFVTDANLYKSVYALYNDYQSIFDLISKLASKGMKDGSKISDLFKAKLHEKFDKNKTFLYKLQWSKILGNISQSEWKQKADSLFLDKTKYFDSSYNIETNVSTLLPLVIKGVNGYKVGDFEKNLGDLLVRIYDNYSKMSHNNSSVQELDKALTEMGLSWRREEKDPYRLVMFEDKLVPFLFFVKNTNWNDAKEYLLSNIDNLKELIKLQKGGKVLRYMDERTDFSKQISMIKESSSWKDLFLKIKESPNGDGPDAYSSEFMYLMMINFTFPELLIDQEYVHNLDDLKFDIYYSLDGPSKKNIKVDKNSPLAKENEMIQFQNAKYRILRSMLRFFNKPYDFKLNKINDPNYVYKQSVLSALSAYYPLDSYRKINPAIDSFSVVATSGFYDYIKPLFENVNINDIKDLIMNIIYTSIKDQNNQITIPVVTDWYSETGGYIKSTQNVQINVPTFEDFKNLKLKDFDTINKTYKTRTRIGRYNDGVKGDFYYTFEHSGENEDKNLDLTLEDFYFESLFNNVDFDMTYMTKLNNLSSFNQNSTDYLDLLSRVLLPNFSDMLMGKDGTYLELISNPKKVLKTIDFDHLFSNTYSSILKNNSSAWVNKTILDKIYKEKSQEQIQEISNILENFKNEKFKLDPQVIENLINKETEVFKKNVTQSDINTDYVYPGFENVNAFNTVLREKLNNSQNGYVSTLARFAKIDDKSKLEAKNKEITQAKENTNNLLTFAKNVVSYLEKTRPDYNPSEIKTQLDNIVLNDNLEDLMDKNILIVSLLKQLKLSPNEIKETPFADSIENNKNLVDLITIPKEVQKDKDPVDPKVNTSSQDTSTQTDPISEDTDKTPTENKTENKDTVDKDQIIRQILHSKELLILFGTILAIDLVTLVALLVILLHKNKKQK